jgi:hypothetical protein
MNFHFVIEFFIWPIPSSRTVALGSSQPLTKRIPRIFVWVKGNWCVMLTTSVPSVSRLSRKYESLNFSQPCGLPRIASLHFYLYFLYAIFQEPYYFHVVGGLIVACKYDTTFLIGFWRYLNNWFQVKYIVNLRSVKSETSLFFQWNRC